ncbi:RNA-binding region-containing protein 3-like [Frankliniella occidentalis]|uniref:RNA-binding region-containing protein 3 n=1 Tax=Frankliniella occidentalis TaxID=133901 RepID=A0A6J1SSH7_FRAOC|nr:RNA-binding region-containing protein 3-like [Frankliniella occidentalis]
MFNGSKRQNHRCLLTINNNTTTMSLPKGDSNLTLRIRHMPRDFSDSDKLEFLQHFGAVSIRSVCIGGKNNEAVFAKFPTPSAAKAALLRLHQMEVLGCHLTVEYSHSIIPSFSDQQVSSSDKGDIRPEEDNRQRMQDQFMRRLVSWSSRLNLSQPPPSHLHYQYPPPTPATLSNISRALSMHPRLYTQLLHLMNRMNLPPPFQDGSRLKSTCNQETQTEIIWVHKSSSESEMESEEEQIIAHPNTSILKRMLPRRQVRPIKRPHFIKPAVPSEMSSSSSNMKAEEVFEKAETCVLPKKIELRLCGSLPLEKEESENIVSSIPTCSDQQGGFGIMHPPIKSNESLEEVQAKESDCLEETGSTITLEQLASNRVPQKDLQVLPVFKNYSPGVPSCRLYVKNISKHATARDLHFIYRRYSKVPEQDCEGLDINIFDVRLMTEGRMKGQAFITLPTQNLAEQALLETNGYILKDKPLVVQFARSAPAPAAPLNTL